MARVHRAGDQPRSRRTLALASLLFGALIGLLLSSARGSLVSKAAADGGDVHTAEEVELLQDQTAQLQAQVSELKTQRDAARREISTHSQLTAELEAKLADAKAAAKAAAAKPAATCTDRHTPWKPSPERAKSNPALAEFLKGVAVDNEVLVAVSNANYAWPGGMLEVWMQNVRRAGVKNAMVLALDEATKENVEKFGLPAFRMDVEIPESQKDVGSNHAVSALKFRILSHFVKLGYAVLLSDVDIVTLSNPFDALHRDSDVESMSDGWDDGTAYGYNDVQEDKSMGWARYAHSMRIFVFNSGLFYLRPTPAAQDLLDKLILRVETENGWDQALFNECIFFPNSPRNKDPAVTRRTMDIHQFMNSKVLFKHLRHNAPAFKAVRPVMVHVNYHPNKFERMKAIVEHYVDGVENALDKFPDGSE